MTTDIENAGSLDTRAEAERTPQELRNYWDKEISLAWNKEDKWRKKATEAVKTYRMENESAFNILHANTQTLCPAIYNSLPVPDIRTRFLEDDKPAHQAGRIMERAISFTLDEQDFHNEMKALVLDFALPGRGVSWVNLEFPDEYIDQETGEQVGYECVKMERIPWDHFLHGRAYSWADMPWVARKLYLTKDEVSELAGSKLAEELQYDCETDDKKKGNDANINVFKMAECWQIWDREKREVVYFAKSLKDRLLAIQEDPLGLIGFFPTPRPLVFIRDPDGMVPVVPYTTYEKQAMELRHVSDRIIRLTEACKYRGIRAADIQLEGLEDAADGEFIPSPNAMSILQMQSGDLNKAIWTQPIEVIIAVIRELVQVRENIKQTIYEITGIADILRGASDPRETMGAQKIKAQWGSLRIQDAQEEVQRYCRDIFRIMAELIGNKFSPETLAAITRDGSLTGEAQREYQQQVQEKGSAEGVPEPVTAEQVMNVLRSDMQRRYRIDVETDSTIAADLVRRQENYTKFIQASASFLQHAMPAVQAGLIPGDAAAMLYGEFTKVFKLGRKVEDKIAELVPQAAEKSKQIEQEQQQAKQKADEADQLAKAELQAKVQREQAEAMKTQAEAGKVQSDMQIEGQKAQTDNEKAMAEIQKLMAEAQKIAAEAGMVGYEGETGPTPLEQEKTAAEIGKLHAETEKVRMETARVPADLALEADKQNLERQEKKDF